MTCRPLLWAGLVFGLAGRAEPPAGSESRWTEDDHMVAFFQAACELSSAALEPGSVEDIVRNSLTAHLRATDPYAQLLSAEDYRLVLESRRETYGGVGMEIARTGEGVLRCLPYPGSPAEEAGIREGETLSSVNGAPVGVTEPLMLVGAKVRGPVGSVVRLGIRGADGEERRVALARAQVRNVTVLPAGTNTWRILAFDLSTPTELKAALENLPPEATVILDLRGNPGGSLGAAIETARLFLEEQQAVVEVHARKGVTRHTGRPNGAFTTRPRLLLWQDRDTASAAEVFIAALVQNGRAKSVGRTTFGKGVTQRTVELINGMAMVMTDGRLVTPDGKGYDGIGLMPTERVDGAGTEAYRKATEALLPQPVPAAVPGQSPPAPPRKKRGLFW